MREGIAFWWNEKFFDVPSLPLTHITPYSSRPITDHDTECGFHSAQNSHSGVRIKSANCACKSQHVEFMKVRYPEGQRPLRAATRKRIFAQAFLTPDARFGLPRGQSHYLPDHTSYSRLTKTLCSKNVCATVHVNRAFKIPWKTAHRGK